MSNDDEFIVLDEIINSTNSKITKNRCEVPIESTSLEKLYQIQGITSKKGAILKYIGENYVRPTIIIHEFKFKKYQCQIVSYLLSDIDIKIANDNCTLKMIGLLIKNKKKVVAAITMSFYTFIHRKEKTTIEKYISQQEDKKDKILPGFYTYEFKYYDGDIEKNERIKIFELFPGRTKCIYELINLLSNEKLSFLFNKF